MSRGKNLLSYPFIQWFLIIFTIMVFVPIVWSIPAGEFVPLMTSEIDELGICLTDKRFLSLSHVPAGTETLYICGNLAGETKRSASFRLNYNTKDVFYIHPSPSLKPGEFFIPVKASSLHGGVESDTFPMGDYQLQAAYSRDPLLFFNFRVE